MARAPGTAASVLERCDLLAALSEVSGEITRPYGTRSLLRALDLIDEWVRAAALVPRRDAAGSAIGRRGRPGLPALLLGSHVDSVRNAGRYDGPLGVLVALAALERLGERSLPFAVELVAFADEEGLRFRSSYLASRAFAGLLPTHELDVVDDDGVTLAEAMRAMGGDPGLLGALRPPGALLGYVEVHIEQGPVLEDAGLPVGVVTAIAGQSRGFVAIAGRAGHAGNTPLRLRRDSLLGAAELVLAAEREMLETPGLVATVGSIVNEPNVGNVIPGRTVLSYDVRHQEDAIREQTVARLGAVAARICERRGLEVDWRHLQDHPAVAMSPRLRTLLASAVGDAGAEPFELPSGAGHDAVSIAHLTEVAMLFVRCAGGVSHHPDESVREEDVEVAIGTIEQLLHRLAAEPAGG